MEASVLSKAGAGHSEDFLATPQPCGFLLPSLDLSRYVSRGNPISVGITRYLVINLSEYFPRVIETIGLY